MLVKNNNSPADKHTSGQADAQIREALPSGQIVPLNEAFRLILRAALRKPNETWPDKIVSLAWFMFPSTHNRSGEDVAAAEQALKELRAHVRRGDLHLRGSIDGSKPEAIDLGDQNTGELKIFENVFKSGRRIYEHVHCLRQEVDQLINPAKPRKLRHPSDGPLIDEALRALREGRATNPSQAAGLVYKRADGPNPDTNKDRLRKLISKEWKAQQPKIAKDHQS